jgi:hypothetical protein
MTDVTRILNLIEQGDAGATEKLLPIVYEELRIPAFLWNCRIWLCRQAFDIDI